MLLTFRGYWVSILPPTARALIHELSLKMLENCQQHTPLPKVSDSCHNLSLQESDLTKNGILLLSRPELTNTYFRNLTVQKSLRWPVSTELFSTLQFLSHIKPFATLSIFPWTKFWRAIFQSSTRLLQRRPAMTSTEGRFILITFAFHC